MQWHLSTNVTLMALQFKMMKVREATRHHPQLGQAMQGKKGNREMVSDQFIEFHDFGLTTFSVTLSQ
jgi:hypothetical protein